MSVWTNKKTKEIISGKRYNSEHTQRDGDYGYVDADNTTYKKEYTQSKRLRRVIQKHYGFKKIVRNRVPRYKNGSFNRWEDTYNIHIKNLRQIFENGLEKLNLDIEKNDEFFKLFTEFIYKCSSGEINSYYV